MQEVLDRIKKEEYKASLFCFLLASLIIYIAPSFPLVYIALPFVLAYSVARGGYYIGGAAAILSFLFAYLLSVFAAAVLAAAFLPVAFAAGYAIRSKKRLLHSVIITSAAAVAGAALAIYLASLLSGLIFIDYTANYLTEIFKSQDDNVTLAFYQAVRYPDILSGAITLQAVEATPAAKAVTIMQYMIKETLNAYLISLLGIYSLLGGYLYYIIPRAIAKNNRMEVAAIPAFSDYVLPKLFWLAFVLSYLAASIGAGIGWKSFDIVESTVFNLYVFVFSIQALCFMDFLYKKRNTGSGARVALHIFVMLIFGSFLALVGLIENIFSLRNRMDERQA
jgi:hypothetical protein